ncbi:hypothetical protein M514_25453 [Trichuris suis]|uniref:Uncharacterized protein n=1 Tax=Trichuris suis TaxID=68888 RepID=A0A085MYN4_9BILA|nr:hypothetical protein M514_25453 [Trichuris suis]
MHGKVLQSHTSTPFHSSLLTGSVTPAVAIPLQCDAIPCQVYKMIKGRDANVTWGCNSRTENERLYKKHADINILCPFSQYYLYLLLFLLGLLPHIPIKETVIEVPVPSSFVKYDLGHFINCNRLSRLHCSSVSGNWSYLPSFIRKKLATFADIPPQSPRKPEVMTEYSSTPAKHSADVYIDYLIAIAIIVMSSALVAVIWPIAHMGDSHLAD